MDKALKNYKTVLKVLKVNIEIIKNNDLVIGVKTLLNTAFIAL